MSDPQHPGPGYPAPVQYQPGPPPKKKHTLRNVLLILALLFVLCVGGCLALIGGAAHEIDKSLKEEAANDKPNTVAEGKAFTHDGYDVDAGWRVAKDDLGSVTIKGLRITNTEADDLTGEGGRTALLTFRLYDGSENLAEITCDGKELQVGESSTMDCFSTDDYPRKFSSIKVADAF